MSMLRSGATDGEGSCASRGCSHNERIGCCPGPVRQSLLRQACDRRVCRPHHTNCQSFQVGVKADRPLNPKSGREVHATANALEHGKHAGEYCCHTEPNLRSFAVPV
jgi:hypothetical protein